MQRPILLISLLFLVLIAVVILFLLPEYQKLRELRILLGTKQKDLAIKNEYFDKIRDISSRLSNYSEEIEKVDLMLPQDPGIADFFDFIIATASKNGLIVNNGSEVSKSSFPESKVKKVILQFSLSGSYESFKSFLRELQKNVRLIEIEGTSFSLAENEIFNFNLKVRIHSYQ